MQSLREGGEWVMPSKILPGTGRGTMRSMVEGLRRPSVSLRLPPVTGRLVPQTNLGLPGAIRPVTRFGEELG